MVKTNNTVVTPKMIVNALYNKSKRSFTRESKKLNQIVNTFSPIYRDFIYKIITNNYLKIKRTVIGSYTIVGDDEPLEKLTRKTKNKVYINLEEENYQLSHELGHVVDFWFGNSNALSEYVVIQDNKTLYDIFFEEFDEKADQIYQELINEYKAIIISNINEKGYEIFTSNLEKYRELINCIGDVNDKELLAKRKAIQKSLYESGFVEVYYQINNKKCYSIINQKYRPILDALSSKYDFFGLCLAHHDFSYYQFKKGRIVNEFFANLFSSEVTSSNHHFDHLIKYLPKSFSAFQKLFNMFYERLQNNKKFTDLTLKRRLVNVPEVHQSESTQPQQ